MATYICVEPISPTYSTLPRLNTLALLLFLLLSPWASWATTGALAALMTRTAAIAFHAIALLVTLAPPKTFASQDPLEILPAFDLDIIGTWIVLSAVSAAVPLLLGWSAALKRSQARFLVKTWSCLIVIGGVCAFVAIRKSITSGVGYDSDDLGERETVHDMCLSSSKSPLRAGEAVLFDAERIFGRLRRGTLLWTFDTMALVSMGFVVFICLLGSKTKSRQSACYDLWFRLGGLIMVMSAVVLPAIIVLHELFLLKSYPGSAALPMTEGLSAFEQWNCWAATGLVLAATVLNWLVGKKRTKQATSLPVHEEQGANEILENNWNGLIGKPLPAMIR